MITSDNGFDLNVRWRFPEARRYAFVFISLFIVLGIIYANSFKGDWIFDDAPNIVQNSNIHIDSLDWSSIKQTFYGVEGRKISRPFSYASFALNYYFHELDVFGYHVVNLLIHYLAGVFLFLFIFNTLRLPLLRDRYGSSAYAIALLAAFLWATNPVLVTSVTYIVQRMASMAGLFYIMAMYFYLKGRTAGNGRNQAIFWILCVLSALMAVGSKENAVMVPFAIWIFDLLLIQGATRENVVKNLKVFVPAAVVVAAIGLWYINIGAILSGSAYDHRPFTLVERLLTQPRIILFYITLLLYPISSRLTLIYDMELSTSLLAPWTTMPAIASILAFLVLAFFIIRRSPLISFCIFFFFVNHIIESSFLPLELMYEHRNYIPSMMLFVLVALFMVRLLDYFSYKRIIQYMVAVVITAIIIGQGHTVFTRNVLFAHPLLLWSDNVEKTPTLSRTHNNLGAIYWDMGCHDQAFEHYVKAKMVDRQTNLANKGANDFNLGMYYMEVLSDYDRALAFFEEAREAYPGLSKAYHQIAICYIRKGDPAEAGNRLLEGLSIWPGNASMRQTLSFLLFKAGEYDQAIQEAKEALAISPDQVNALAILGGAYKAKGNDSLATFYWEQYHERSPRDLEAILALIELYHQQGRKNDLTRTVGKILVLGGWESWAELLERLLGDRHMFVYTPEPDSISTIIRDHLNEVFVVTGGDPGDCS